MARHDYQPFGEEIQRAAYGSDDIRQQFTGYERDKESDLDFAQVRMYNKNLGRFTTSDPVMMEKDRQLDPHMINLYVYVRNNPLKFIDITGETLILANSNARRTFTQVMNYGLTPAERKNLTVLADGRVILRNPNAVNLQNASFAYQQLAGIINNRNLTIKVYSVAQGQTANGVSYQDAYNNNGLTFGSRGDATREVVIPVGGADDVTGNPAGSGNKVPSPEDAIFAHEVFGHGSGNDGDAAINAENNYRISRNPALGERSGEDHRHQVDVGESPADPVVENSITVPTTIVTRPLEPLIPVPPRQR